MLWYSVRRHSLSQGGMVMDLESIVRELDKVVACDLGYADGESEETNEWSFRFVVRCVIRKEQRR